MLKLTLKITFYTLCSALLACAYLLHLFIHSPLNVPYRQEFVVEKGATIGQISRQLQEKNVIKSARLFHYLAWYRGDISKIKAGEYLLEPNLTPVDLLQKIVNWDVIQHNFTIISGWTVRQALYSLHKQKKIKITLPECDIQALASKLLPDSGSANIEGMLWPDTYFYTAGTTDVEMLQRAYNMMQLKLLDVWQTRDTNIELKNINEMVTLASILEKEANIPNEYYKISGVFHRRLQINMPLQADPTLIYATNQSIDCSRLTTRVDLSIESPYNSYKNYGLPPTPIAIPSLKALHAAVHPTAGDALYFVADGKGGHVFSATLEEHNKAVIAYRQMLLQQIAPLRH